MEIPIHLITIIERVKKLFGTITQLNYISDNNNYYIGVEHQSKGDRSITYKIILNSCKRVNISDITTKYYLNTINKISTMFGLTTNDLLVEYQSLIDSYTPSKEKFVVDKAIFVDRPLPNNAIIYLIDYATKNQK